MRTPLITIPSVAVPHIRLPAREEPVTRMLTSLKLKKIIRQGSTKKEGVKQAVKVYINFHCSWVSQVNDRDSIIANLRTRLEGGQAHKLINFLGREIRRGVTSPSFRDGLISRLRDLPAPATWAPRACRWGV